MNRCVKQAALAAACAWLGCPLAIAAEQDTQPATVRDAMAQAASSVDDVLSRTGRDARYLVFAAAANLRILIEGFRFETRALDAPPSRLPPPQRQLFHDIEQAVADLQMAATEPTGQARETLKELRRVTDDAVPAGAQLLGAGPAVLAADSPGAVHFTIRGARLKEANPRLFLSNMEASRVTVDAHEAMFSIPVQALGFNETTPSVRSGRLVLQARQCTLLVFCGSVSHEYPIALLLLPDRLATVQVHFNRKVKERVYVKADVPAGARPAAVAPPATATAATGAPSAAGTSTATAAPPDKVFTRTFQYSNPDMTLMSCSTQTQAPHASGFLIDTGSLTLTVSSTAGATRSRIATASPQGFTVELCAQAQISHMMKTNGAISAQASWKEYQMADVVQPTQSLPPQALRWNTPVVVSLPAGTSAIAVDVSYFDGSRVTYNGDASDELIHLKWDRARQQILIAARNTADIEGIN